MNTNITLQERARLEHAMPVAGASGPGQKFSGSGYGFKNTVPRRALVSCQSDSSLVFYFIFAFV